MFWKVYQGQLHVEGQAEYESSELKSFYSTHHNFGHVLSRGLVRTPEVLRHKIDMIGARVEPLTRDSSTQK